MRDPYSVLGVAKSASASDIKKAFRKLAKQFHPDQSKDPKAASKFAEVNAAYEIIGDEAKRAQFDRGEIDAEGKPRFQGFEGFGRGAGAGGFTREGGPGFGSFGFGFGSGGPTAAAVEAGGSRTSSARCSVRLDPRQTFARRRGAPTSMPPCALPSPYGRSGARPVPTSGTFGRHLHPRRHRRRQDDPPQGPGGAEPFRRRARRRPRVGDHRASPPVPRRGPQRPRRRQRHALRGGPRGEGPRPDFGWLRRPHVAARHQRSRGCSG